MVRILRYWNPHLLLVGIKNGAAILENSLVIPQLNMKLPFDLEIPLVSIYPKEIKHIFIKTML
jgi:hypothetical protein